MSRLVSSARLVAATLLVLTLAAVTHGEARAQLDTRHWIPPLFSVNGTDTGVIDDHYVYISTPEVSPVAFTLQDGAGNTFSGTVTNATPVILQIGNNAGSYAPYTAGGWSGTHTSHIVLGAAGLNATNTDGLIVDAERPVYVSVRQKSGSQGEILASPGRKGLGTEFRALFARNVLSTNAWRGSFISVMATEPGTTTIVFDDIKPGVRLYGLPDANADGTTDVHSVTLSQNQSYIVGILDTSYTGTAPLADFNGTRVTSDKLVAVTSGYFLGGPSAGSGQDAGFDQLVPTELAGLEYVMIKGNALATSELETVTVVATQDDTDIFVKGESTPLNPSPLMAGDWYWVHNQYVGDGLYLRASKPVLVVQGIGGSDSLATPGANVIPPIGEDAAAFVDNIPTANFYGTATVGIVTRAGATVTLNGAAPAVAPQAIFGTSDWVTYKITGVTGHAAVYSNAAVSVSLINVSGVAGLAGYFSGFPSSRTLDLDQDDTVDGGDNCPDDPNQDQIDDDGDGIGNLCDQCDDDPQKALSGICGCGTPDADFDGDGIICSDNCPYDANVDQADGDLDGVGDACADDLDNDGVVNELDGCPLDRKKTAAGYCGCGFLETDSDLDGTPNCVDACPLAPSKTDPGACGCGTADTDSDGDGTADCVDVCGNGVVDAGEACDDTNLVNTDACTTQCQYRPVAAADSADVIEDAFVVIDVQANDPTAAERVVTTLVDVAPQHGQAVVESDGKITYTPTPGYAGPDQLSYRLADVVSQSDAVIVTLTVLPNNHAPVAVDDDAAVDEGQGVEPFSVRDNDSDEDGDELVAVLVTGPAHAAYFNLDADGYVEFVHDGSETTSDSFTYRLDDGEDTSAPATVTLTVTPINDLPVALADAIALAEGATATGLVGGQASLLANDQDAEGQALTAVLVAGPAHGALTVASDGTFSYTHDGGESTSDSFSYRAHDGVGGSAPVTVSVSVTPVDDAPAAGADSVVVAEGGTVTTLASSATSLLENDSDAEGQALTAELVQGPTRAAAFTLHPDGTFSYQHDGSETSSDSFSYRARAGALTSGTITVAITVTPVNDTPVAVADVIAVAEGGVATSLGGGATSLLANDIDAEGASLSAVLVAGPGHGALVLQPDGSFSYTHDGGETSSDSFSYRVSDGVATSAPVSVSISVTPIDDAPVAVADHSIVAEGGSTSTVGGGFASVLTNDSDAEGQALTAELVSDPAHGTLTFAANGTFLYRHDGSETTSDSFSYRALAGGVPSASVSVTVTVSPRNDAPVAAADHLTVAEGGVAASLVGGEASVLANDTDAEGQALTAELVQGAAHGTLALAADGTFVYTHGGADVVSDSFAYRARDGVTASAPVTVTIAVAVVDDAPVAAADTIAVAEGAAATQLVGGQASVLDNDGDDEGQALSAELVTGPAHGALALASDGTFTYTHDGSETTSDGFSYRVVAGGVASSPMAVSIAVAPVDDAPVAAADQIGVAEGGVATTLSSGQASLLANDSDAEGQALGAVLDRKPAHGSVLLAEDGTFSYTHDGSEATSDSFTYHVVAGGVPSTVVTVSVVVSGDNDTPVAVADTLQVAEGAAATTLVGGNTSLLGNDQDADGDTLQALLVTGPAHGTLTLAADGTFGYTHDGSETASDSFSYRAWDGVSSSAPVTITITVTPVDDAPIAAADELVVIEGQAASALAGAATSVLANDADAEGDTLAAELVTPPAHGALVLAADGTFSYTHDGSETTSDSFTYRARAAGQASAGVSVAIAVTPANDAPVGAVDAILVGEGEVATTLAGHTTSVLANDGDADGDDLVAVLVTGPAHGALVLAADGTFSYTHDGSETTSDSFSYEARDASAGSGPISVAITVRAVNNTPVAGADRLVVAEGASATTTVAGHGSLLDDDVDAEGDALTAVLVSGPAHGTLVLAADGTFSYGHDGSETTLDAFGYRAGDGFALSDTITVVIDVTPVDDAPVARADLVVVAEGAAATRLDGDVASLLANDDDAEGDALTAVVVDAPLHGVLVVAADGTFSYSHDGSEAASDRFSYQAVAGAAASTPVQVEVRVTPVNDAPVAQGEAFEVAEGAAVDGALLSNDVDADGDPLVIELIGAPAHGTLRIGADGTFGYTHDGSESPNDAFSYRVGDGSASSESVDVAITVTPVNDTPVARADHIVAREGAVTTVLDGGVTSLLGNDEDADGDTLVAEVVAAPAHGDLKIAPDGRFSYTHDGSETRADTFTYRVSDGVAASEPVTITITIEAVNDVPVAAAESLDVDEGGEASRLAGGAESLLANDQDGDGDTLAATLVSGPLHGSLALVDDGTFSYVHDGSETTEDHFVYVARDADGASEPVTVNVRVAAQNDTPVARGEALHVDEGGAATAVVGGATSLLANDEDADGDTLQARLSDAPRHGAVTIAPDGTFRYTHDGSETTEDAFSYRVEDASASAVATVVVTVGPIDNTPIAIADRIVVDEGASATALDSGAASLLDNDVDAEGDTLVAEVVDAPIHGALELQADGTFRYTHDGSESTVDGFTYRAADAHASSPATTVTIEVRPVNDRPVARADRVTVAEGARLAGLGLIDNDDDADGDTLVAEVVEAPVHGQLVARDDGGFDYVHDGAEAAVDQFSYRASDGQATSEPVVVMIDVTPVNDAPTLGAIADQAVLEDGATPTLPLSVDDADADPDALVVTATSSDEALVPAAGIVLGGHGRERTVRVTPAAGASGIATITVTVDDGLASATTRFGVRVEPQQDAPTLSAIADLTIDEDVAADAITFTVGDAETAASRLVVEVSSDDPTLLPAEGLVLGGEGAERTLEITPADDASGVATVRVSVSDGQDTTSTTFVVTVAAVNDAPRLEAPERVALDEDGARGVSGVRVGDRDAGREAIAVFASAAAGRLTVSPSDDVRVQDEDGELALVGPVEAVNAALATLTYVAAPDFAGADVVALVVDDLGNSGQGGAQRATGAIVIDVGAIDDAPWLRVIGDQDLVDPESRRLSLELGDPDDDPTKLVVELHTSDADVVPAASLEVVADGGRRELVLRSASHAGASVVTVIVTDPSGLSFGRAFRVTVACGDDLDGDDVCDGADKDKDGDGHLDDVPWTVIGLEPVHITPTPEVEEPEVVEPPAIDPSDFDAAGGGGCAGGAGDLGAGGLLAALVALVGLALRRARRGVTGA